MSKRDKRSWRLWIGAALIIGGVMVVPGAARAHCDSLDGPVVQAAEKAIAAGDVNLVLVWVQKGDEAAVRKAFQRTMAVRKLGADAKELADTAFFETVVRLHRAGEGASYTGLKPAGVDHGPAIPMADKAVRTGNLTETWKFLGDAVHEGLHQRWQRVVATRNYRKDDLAAGRAYVEAYVAFIHYVENIHRVAAGGGHGVEGGAEPHAAQAHKH